MRSAGSRKTVGRLAPPVLLVAGLLLLPGVSLGGGADRAAASTHQGLPTPPNDTLRLGSRLAVTPSTFWSLDLQTNNSTGVSTDPAVVSFLNSTSFTWFRYGQDTEACNVTINILYGANGSPSGPCNYNLTAFGSWCLNQRPHCHSILFLPGEANSSAETAYTAAWVVRTLGFQPDYFNLGNEPSLWKHYGIPWAKWNASDHSTPTPLAYALDLHAAILAVRAVDPAARFVGIEADCACGPSWFQEVVHIDGPLIAAIAYHSYPSYGHVNETLATMLAPLFSPLNLTTTYPLVRSFIVGHCHRCATLPIFLNEYNAGPGWAASSWNGTYGNALFLGASYVQALRANVTQFTVFNLQSNKSTYGYSMLNDTNTVGPTGELFSVLLRHLVRGTVFGTVFNTSTGGVLSVLTENAARATLLIVNTNLTRSTNVSVGSVFTTGAVDGLGEWSPGSPSPTWLSKRALDSYTIPPEGLLLLAAPRNSTHAGLLGDPPVTDPRIPSQGEAPGPTRSAVVQERLRARTSRDRPTALGRPWVGLRDICSPDGSFVLCRGSPAHRAGR
ncbi:MAG TPA: hypothetical protein VGP88_08195 [Thermoplasmata archaeon]|nr:hypothetical protein [Thermoplasmata archaeon]